MDKKVLIPITKSPEDYIYDAKESAKLKDYITKLASYGMSPVFVWPELPQEEIDSRLASVGGAVFIGGDDIDAALCGEENHPEVILEPGGRDILELSLMHSILESKIPFLGICRGMQILAIARGGQLIQHLPDVTVEEHGMGLHSVGDEKYKTHDIVVLPGTRAHAMLNHDVIETNSFHHQAVLPGSGNFIISGKSPAGVAEIMEIEGSHFCFGVQGHPERLGGSHLDTFFEELSQCMESTGFPEAAEEGASIQA